MDNETIRIDERDNGIKLLVLNRPRVRNAISIKMRQEICEVVEGYIADTKTSALIITGEGQAFSAGFDIKEFGQTEVHDELVASSTRYHKLIWNFPKPCIAAVNGIAYGGGFDLALLCDIRICSTEAKFSHPEIKFGGPPLFTPLRWIVGHGLARDLCLTGRRIDAQEAHRIGLVSSVVDPKQLLDQALATCNQILEAPAHTLASVKQYLIGNVDKDFEESFAVEHDEVFKKFIGKKK